MKPSIFCLMTMTMSLAICGGTKAATMTESEYEASGERIKAAFQIDKTACESLAGNANDICVAEAEGVRDVGTADLMATYKPNKDTLHDARVAKAEAEYAIHIEKCDDKAGQPKDICVEEAKAAKIRAVSDADAQLTTTEANLQAGEKAGDARQEAQAEGIEARKDAALAESDADSAVAMEKCDLLAGGAKDACISEAKIRFGN